MRARPWMTEQFGESIANKEGELGRKILWAVAAVIIGLVILRISCPAVSHHLPFGPNGRTLLAQGVDAFDLSHDGKRIAIISGGKLQGINVDGSMNREHPNAVLAKPGYTSAEICWSVDDLKIAATICYPNDTSFIRIIDVNSGTTQEIAKAFALGNPVWLEDGKRLAWIQREDYSKSHRASIYVWRDGSRTTEIYGDEPANFFWLKMIPGNDSMGFIHIIHSDSAGREPGEPFSRLEIMQHNGTRPRSIPAPPGQFPIPFRGFMCWDISQDAKMIAYVYGWSIWLTGSAQGDNPIELGKYAALEIKWSPDGRRIGFVTTSPKSVRKRSSDRGQKVISPPHELHLINKDGSGHRLVCTEPQGIKSIEWLNNNEVLYLSGKDLYKRGL